MSNKIDICCGFYGVYWIFVSNAVRIEALVAGANRG